MTPLLALDAYFGVMIVMFIVPVAAAGFAFWFLEKKGPRLGVLLLGFACLVASYLYDPQPIVKVVNGRRVAEHSLELNLFDGLLGLIGLAGILLGIVVLVRCRPKRAGPSKASPAVDKPAQPNGIDQSDRE